MKNFALIISAVLSPLVLIPGAFIVNLLAQNPPLMTQEFWKLAGLFFLFGYFPGILFLILFKRTGRISNWDISVRSERHLFNVTILILLLFLFYCAQIFEINLLLNFALTAFVWFLVFTLTTFIWKVSFHSAALTFFILSANQLAFQNTAVYMYYSISVFLVCVMVWSRIYLKQHTLFEVSLGIVMTIAVYWFVIPFAASLMK